MAAKPSIALARWADQIGANLVSPTSDERDLGFGNATTASSGKVNTELNQLYQWALYLNDGALSGDHSIAGGIAVNGSPLTITPTTFTVSGGLATITAHGRRTGDGPFRVSNTGGALPTGLTAGTDYWLIVANANVFQFATSFADAIASKNVALSTDGTGTQTLSSTGSTQAVSDATVSRNVTAGGHIDAGGVLTAGIAIKGTGARAAAPTTGTHAVGEVVFNADPISGGFIGWVCVTSGSPGTWKSWGVIS